MVEKWQIQPAHFLATIVHPRLRTFCGDESLQSQGIALLRSSIATRCSSNERTFRSSNDITSPPISNVAASCAASDILSKCFDQPQLASSTADEVSLWMQAEFDPKIIDDDPLSFWRKKKDDFPMIANIARDVLAIPASNTSVERLFSAAKLVVTDRRTSLGAEKIDKLMFLKKNLLVLKQMIDAKVTSPIDDNNKRKIVSEEQTTETLLPKKIKFNQENDTVVLSDDCESDTDF